MPGTDAFLNLCYRNKEQKYILINAMKAHPHSIIHDQ